MPETFDFSEALRRLKDGSKLCRTGWNGKGMWVALQVPDANSKMTEPYIYIKDAFGRLVPWLASQNDLMSEDWMIA